jgi:hypothetical protein
MLPKGSEGLKAGTLHASSSMGSVGYQTLFQAQGLKLVRPEISPALAFIGPKLVTEIHFHM